VPHPKTFRHEPFTPLALEVRPVDGGSGFDPSEFGSQRPDAGAARGSSGECPVSAQGHGSVVEAGA